MFFVIPLVEFDLGLRREINRYLAREDPYGTLAFVAEGLERGQLRRDVDPDLVASVLEWTVERFQDALLAEELFPGFMRRGPRDPARTRKRIDEFVRVLEDAIGARGKRAGVSPPRARRAPRR